MIFRLKTSKRTQEIFQELENRTNYKPYTLVNMLLHGLLKKILQLRIILQMQKDWI